MDRIIAQRRRALLNMRKTIRAHRHFDVELLPDGREKQTCRTCGKSVVHDPWKCPDGSTVSLAMREKLTKYRTSGSGVGGVCPTCTKRARDERYPLPKAGN